MNSAGRWLLFLPILAILVAGCQKEHKLKQYDGTEDDVMKVAFMRPSYSEEFNPDDGYFQVPMIRDIKSTKALDVPIKNNTPSEDPSIQVFTPEATAHFDDGASVGYLRVNFDQSKLSLFDPYKLNLAIDLGDTRSISSLDSATVTPKMLLKFGEHSDVKKLHCKCDFAEIDDDFSVGYVNIEEGVWKIKDLFEEGKDITFIVYRNAKTGNLEVLCKPQPAWTHPKYGEISVQGKGTATDSYTWEISLEHFASVGSYGPQPLSVSRP